MLQHYRMALTEAFQKSDKLKKHTLLKSPKWTKAGYELLSDLIGSELSKVLTWDEQRLMGSSISAKTLQNFFDGNYRLSYPIDPRTLNTLNKLVRFVGFADWDAFTEAKDGERVELLAEADDATLIENHVREAINAEFQAYWALPKMDLSALKPFYTEGGTLPIENTLTTYQTRNWLISNAFNPSTVEVLAVDIVKIQGDYAQVKTKEYWLLCWYSPEQARFVSRVKDITDHFYVLTKDKNGKWFIKTNASTAELNEVWRKDDTEAVPQEVVSSKPKTVKKEAKPIMNG